VNNIVNSEQLATKIGPYRRIEPIGSGATGDIYLAVQESTGQQVAVKVMKSNSSDSEKSKLIKTARFKREMELCTRIRHPNIIQVLDFGELDGNTLFTVFEYIPGVTLASMLEHEGALRLDRCKNLLVQILEAMHAAHSIGIIHRDLKPENIMVIKTASGEHIKILDFGISASIPMNTLPETRLTTTQEFLGTPAYSAPEQLRGEPVTFKADLFSWGLIAIECMSGLPAYQENTMARLVQKMLSSDPVPIPRAVKSHPLGSILAWVLEKNPSRRAGDASQVLKRLSTINFSEIPEVKGYFHNEIDSSPEKNDLSRSSSAYIVQERKQLAILSLLVHFETIDDSDAETDIYDELFFDILTIIKSIAQTHGGFLSNDISDRLLFCFGYPYATGNETKKAALTALQIAVTCTQRNILFQSQHGIKIVFNAGIHAGMVPVRKNPSGKTLLAGIVPAIAGKLSANAGKNSILISKKVHTILQSAFDCMPMNVDEGPDFFLLAEKQTESMHDCCMSISNYFAGRLTECSFLQKNLETAFSTKGAGVLISGEAGIGKSRLIAELLNKNPARTWIEFRCTEENANNALFPVIDFFSRRISASSISNTTDYERSLEKILACSSVNKDQFISLFMYWTAADSKKYPPLQIAPVKQKQLFISLLIRFFTDYALAQNAIVIIEDLHWGDATTMEFITDLLANASSAKLFLLMTARPSFSHQWNKSIVREIVLHRLEDEEIGALIDKCCEQRMTNAITAEIIEKADGNPLYAMELIRSITHLIQEKSDKMSNGSIPFIIPDTLRDLLAQRLDMTGIARETAQIASVIGRRFDYNLLVKITLRDEGTLLADLDQLVSSGLIHSVQKSGALSYIFHHALVRDIAYQSLTSEVRSDIHRKIAATLESDYPETAAHEPGVLARHWAAAGEAEKAAHYCIRAAHTALEKSAFGDTIYHSETALRLLPASSIKDKVNVELTVNSNYIQAMMSMYGWADGRVRANAERSRKLLEECTDKTLLVPTLWMLAIYHHVAGNRREVRDLSEELARIAEQADDPSLKVVAATLKGIRYQADGEYTKSAQALEYVVKSYNHERDNMHALTFGFDTRAYSEATLGVVYWFTGYRDKAEKTCENAVAWARAIKHIPSLCIALLYNSLIYYHERNKTKTSEIMSELLELSEKYGLPAYTGYGSIIQCWAKGDPEKIRGIIETLKQLGCKLALALYGAMLADSLADSGETAEALRQIDICLEYCSKDDERNYEAGLYLKRALYEYKLFPWKTESIHRGLLKAVELARAQGACRIETEAMNELTRLYGNAQV
jgi:TOMM system kinase/cyclase fusion protein